jgi:gliding motility-associated-like protein
MRHFIYIFISLFYFATLNAQHTTQGRDFWVSFGNNVESSSVNLTFQIRIVTLKPAKVTFTFTNLGTSTPVDLVANSVYTRDLSEIERLAVYSDTDGKTNKSLHIESDEDISIYAINLIERSTDATAVLPLKSLGNSYYHVSYAPVFESPYMDGYTVIATENDTKIYEDKTYKTILDRGDVYSQYFTEDATGRHITADKPIAYFTTNSCVFVPDDVYACDCLYEQLFPETVWGASYMVPATMRGKERVRVLASTDGTKITHTGGTVVDGSLSLDAGQYVEIEISRSDDKDENGKSCDGCYIESNNPVAVASYLTGLEYDNTIYAGDPAMTWIPSLEQSVSELLLAPFVASGSSLLSEHYVLIVTLTENRGITEMSIGNGDYTLLSDGSWTDHIAGYSFYSMPLTTADQSYRFRNPGGLTVMGYGLGERESYYYLGGSATRKLNVAFYINDIHYEDLNGKEFCSDNFEIKAVVKYNMHPDAGHLRWFIDGTEEIAARDLLQWKKTLAEETHTISMIAANEDNKMDTLSVLFAINVQNTEINDTTMCKGQSIELKVNNPTDKLTYRWYGDPDFSNFIKQGTVTSSPLKSDTVFYLEARSDIGCRIRDSIRVNIHPVDLQAGDIEICNNLTVTPKASSASAVSLKWYGDTGLSRFIAQANEFETGILKNDTVFYIETLYANGCIVKDSVKIAINPSPKLTVRDTSVCAETPTAFSVPSDAVSLDWYSDASFYKHIVQSFSHTVTLSADTVFYVEALSDKGCIIRDSMKVSVLQPPSVKAMEDRYLCYGEEITLSVLQSEGSVNWNVNALTFIPKSTQEYIVTASRPPCPDIHDNVIITLGDSLFIVPSVLPPYRPYTNYSILLTSNAESPDYSVFRGDLPPGLSLYGSGDLLGIPDESDVESVFTVLIKDKYNCTVTQDFVLERYFFIPRLFTPNGDGINDIFMQGYEIIVFDRLGIEIFKGNNGWDGTYKNKHVPQGIYFYSLNRILETGKIKTYNGYIGIK